jgi:hypothetical protein
MATAGPGLGMDEFDDRRAKECWQQRALADAKADASAVWALADFYLPPDMKEWAAEHRIPELTAHAWRTAFVAGWRAAKRSNAGDE